MIAVHDYLRLPLPNGRTEGAAQGIIKEQSRESIEELSLNTMRTAGVRSP
jgi:hypothetical protein